MSDKFPIPDRVREGAHVQGWDRYNQMYQRSVNDPDGFWGEMARDLVTWRKDFDTIDSSDMPNGKIRWFEGGQLNVCENCVDRHAEARGDKVAILHEGDEPGNVTRITYAELKTQVCKLANVLKDCGVKRGDSVAIYLPMIPTAAVAMLACARIGAVHSVVFGGFSAQALRDRILDATSKVVITANQGLRGSKRVPLKQTCDNAVSECDCVEKVLVWNHTDGQVEMTEGRDVDLNEAMDAASDQCDIEVMEAEDPLFLLYTSGSTGKPKGIQHCTGGYLVYAAATHKYVFDVREDDVYACVADVGWITGHTYIVYGPLANGSTTVMFESVPTYPDAGRYWDMVQRLGITQFYTAPTAIRAVARAGDEVVKKYDRSSIRVLGTVGEPINPDVWEWYYKVVGDERCTIVDTWWQTETGGIMLTPLPGVTEPKPGSATKPFFGVQPVMLDSEGNLLEGNGVEGILAIKAPWPGMVRTIYGDHQRFRDTYLNPYKGYYFPGDGARRDEDGYYWITGRVDDVINVSGHRMGTAEVESALVAHPSVAEAAVVGYPHEIKGQGIFAYVILKEGAEESDTLIKELNARVAEEIGKIARPDIILVTPGLPKTRSGKIMRRILRKVASKETENLGDVSTLADPSIVETLINKRETLD